MKAALISVGTELLFGQIVNTNTVYLSKKLNELGIDLLYHHTVGDNHKRLEKTITSALEDCDLIITTGGLGPTQDDMTKETVCSALEDELVLHEDILEDIRRRILAYKTEMTENNIKQAYLPSRAHVLYNDAGTAPGFVLGNLQEDGESSKWIACLPGPPREMTRMFEKSLLPWLLKRAESCLFYREIRTFGIGESDLETRLLPVIDDQTDPTVATYAKEGECSVRVASKRKTEAEAVYAVDQMVRKIERLIGQYIYSIDGEEYIEVLAKTLMERKLTIASAESCTGGMFAGALTDISGISQVFERGIVSYSNQSKVDELGVKAETLEHYGAVSGETAMEMAEGVRRISGADIGVSVTGVAGPGGGSVEKPVGLVYIGLSYRGKNTFRKIDRNIKDRQRNRRHAVLSMIDMVYRAITKG